MRNLLSVLAAAACLAPPAAAQQGSPQYVRAIAAGYKAGFLCSNIFNGGLTQAQTDADDLKGTYAELNPLFAELPAQIDRQRRQVRVTYSETMPPRIAQWRPALGCTHLPIGSAPGAAANLPRLVGAGAADRKELDRRPWPMGDLRATARPRGDAAALNRALANAFDRRTYGEGSETTAVLVLQGEKIVAERYRGDFNMHNSQRTWSVAKSIAATVIGRAVQQGIVNLDAPVGLAGAVPVPGIAGGEPGRPWPRVPEWSSPQDPRGAITTNQLLRMSSGLNSDFAGNRTDALYFGGVGIAEQAASFPLINPPGTVFRYANNDTLLAIRALQYGLGDSGTALAFPYEELFWRIGMTRTAAETDHNGHFIMSSQVWTSARDLARLGLLHLKDGVWQGERLLPAGWNDYVRRRGPAQPARGYGYGAGWWTFPADAGLPEDAFIAQGNRGQYVVVVPSRQVVIVRRGFDSTEARFDPAALTRDVLAALR